MRPNEIGDGFASVVRVCDDCTTAEKYEGMKSYTEQGEGDRCRWSVWLLAKSSNDSRARTEREREYLPEPD